MLRDEHCLPFEAARTRSFCEDLAHECFPIESDMGASHHHHALKNPQHHKWDALHDFWLSTFCQAATCAPGTRDKLLQAVYVGRKSAHMSTLALVTLVLLAMFVSAGVLMCLSARLMPRQQPGAKTGGATPSPRGGRGGGGRAPYRCPDADPAGKIGRKPHPPPSSHAASGFGGLNQVPYVARRTHTADMVTAGTFAWSAGGAAPAAAASALVATGQQLVTDAMHSVTATFGVSVPDSQALPASSSQPPLASQPPIVPTTVVHSGSVAGHVGQLHQRHTGSGMVGPAGFAAAHNAGVGSGGVLYPQSSYGLMSRASHPAAHIGPPIATTCSSADQQHDFGQPSASLQSSASVPQANLLLSYVQQQQSYAYGSPVNQYGSAGGAVGGGPALLGSPPLGPSGPMIRPAAPVTAASGGGWAAGSSVLTTSWSVRQPPGPPRPLDKVD